MSSNLFRRGRVLVALLLALGLVAAGCGDDDDGGSNDASSDTTAASGSESPEEPEVEFPDTLKVAAGGSYSFSDGALVEWNNLVEAEGISIETSVIDDASQALRTVIAGQNDIYFGDPVAALLAVSNGDADIKYVATSLQSSDYILLSLPQWEVDDLAGAKVGIAAPGTSGAVIGDAALTKLGVDLGQLEYVEVGGTSARITAILNGQIDIAAAHAPEAVTAANTGNVKVLVNTGEVLGPYLQQGMIVSGDFLEENPEFLQMLVGKLIEASRKVAESEDTYFSVMEASEIESELAPEEMSAAYEQFSNSGMFAVNGGVCDDVVESTLAYSVEAGTITEEAAANPEAFIDKSFVEAFLEEEGTDPSEC